MHKAPGIVILGFIGLAQPGCGDDLAALTSESASDATLGDAATAGLDAPADAQEPTTLAPSPGHSALEGPYVHPIDFHLPSVFYDLSDIEPRLERYVDDINVIFARGTVRQFTLGQIHRRDLPSSSGTAQTKSPLVGAYTFAVFVDAALAGNPTSWGGSSGYQMPDRAGSNELSALGLHWKNVWSSADLADPSNLDDYHQRQIRNLVHELGHLDGLGNSEYYTLTGTDATGVAPTADLSQIPPSPYWAQRSLAYDDPMRNCSFETCEFSPLSKRIIQRAASGYYDSHGCSRGYYFPCTAVAPHSITVRLVRSNDGGRLQGCAIQVYGRTPNRVASSATLQHQGTSNAAGEFTFASSLAHSSFDNALLVEAQCLAHDPVSRWISVFDIQAYQQQMPGGGASGDFRYPGFLLLTMPTLCNNGVCDPGESCSSCVADCPCASSWTLTSVAYGSKVITASKTGEDPTCAHLVNPSGQLVSGQNHCCAAGPCSEAAAPTSLFQAGQQVRLCHGNNSNNCSNYVTITP